MCIGKNLPGFILAGWFVLSSFGCGSSSPTSPDIHQPAFTTGAQARTTTNETCWELYDVTIYSLSQTVEIIPMRNAMFEANVTKFLHPPLAPINLLNITIFPESDFPGGHIVLNVSIRHPFPGTNLRGFDVMGIFMPVEGGNTSVWDPALTWPSNENARLLNPDGYTRWWNQTEFTTYDTIFGYTEGANAVPGFASSCTLNSFKYFADGLDSEADFTHENLMMTDRGSFSTASPGINSRRYDIQFPVIGSNPDFRFKYAISACYWGPVDGSTPPAPVEDYPLTANRAEVVQIGIQDTGSTAYYENATTYGGDLVFDLEITDWQGLEGMDGPLSQISGVYAESPTLFDGVVDLMDTGIVAYEPMNPTMFLGGCTIPNVKPTVVTDQNLLIIITSTDPSDYSVQLPDVTGFVYPENAVLAAFILWEAPISPLGPTGNPCEKGPNLICSGDGNIFVDEYVVEEDNTQFFRNIITFDLGGPNSYNTIVKYYTGHGGSHNYSSITGPIQDIIISEGYTLVDSDEEPIDTSGCRIIFVCLPGRSSSANPFTQDEYDNLVTFIAEGGRVVLTQEYHDTPLQILWGNNFLDGLGSTLDRLWTTPGTQLHINPIECYALTNGVNMVYTPAYTSFSLGAGDKSIVDDYDGLHVIVADWL